MYTATFQELDLSTFEHGEKNDAELIAHVVGNEESTVTELVLSDRLTDALYELELLVNELTERRGSHGQVLH
ncbi:MAG: hypothetical protein ACYC4S_12350 [Rhodoferax sp.]